MSLGMLGKIIGHIYGKDQYQNNLTALFTFS